MTCSLSDCLLAGNYVSEHDGLIEYFIEILNYINFSCFPLFLVVATVMVFTCTILFNNTIHFFYIFVVFKKKPREL